MRMRPHPHTISLSLLPFVVLLLNIKRPAIFERDLYTARHLGGEAFTRQREHFLTPHRGKAELIGWGTEVGSLPARRVLTHGEVSVWGHGP